MSQITAHNLPSELSTFIGRDRALAELTQALTAARLVTLTGVGGVGKTRLGLRVANELVATFADGVRLVELAGLSNPSLVPRALATVLAVHEQPDRSMTDVLADALRPRRLLVVLDNCEHLIEACATLVATLLRACPRLHVLATSREALGVPGELVWLVPPLSLPGPATAEASRQLEESEAVRLFVARCWDALPGFALAEQNAPAVVEICRRLDGLPLAIELAAARIRGLTPEQIAARLDDRFHLLSGGSRTALPRHRTLHAAIEWSHGLLSEPERVLFRRLAVFAGGWAVEAAEGICAGEEIAAEGILDLLLCLVERSLVVADRSGPAVRYRMLETIREYAAERLREAGEAALLRTRHRDWWLGLAERRMWELRGPDQGRLFDAWEADNDNFRVALDWCEARAGPPAGSFADAQAGLRLGFALLRFWRLRGHLGENRRRLARLLAMAPVRDQARTRGLFAAATLALHQGDLVAVSALLEEGLPLAREVDDAWSVAFMLQLEAHVAWRQERYERTVELGEESLSRMRAVGDQTGVAFALSRLADAKWRLGEVESAISLHEECIVVGREIGDPSLISDSLASLASIARDAGDDVLARSHHERALALRRQIDSRQAVAESLNELGRLMLETGDATLARGHFLESLTIARDLDVHTTIAGALAGLAELAAADKQLERAVYLAGAADAVRQDTGLVLTTAELIRHRRRLEPARRSLGETKAVTAWAAGRAMSVDEAIEFALATVLTQAESATRDTARRGIGLTAREREVATLVARGLTNQQIADQLVIAKRTAANHVEHILAKLGFHSRVQIAGWAAEHGVPDVPTSRLSAR